MIYFFNKTLNLISIVPKSAILSAFRTEEINAPARFNAKVLADVDITDVFYVGHRDSLNLNKYYVYRIIDTKWNDPGITITGIDLAHYELSGYGYIRDYRPQERSALEIATNILKESPWTVRSADSSKDISTSFYFTTRLEALYKLLEVSHKEMETYVNVSGSKISGRYIELKDQLGENRGRRYFHGSNILSIVKEEKADSIYTAMIGRGKGEQTESGGYGRRITFESVEWRTDRGDPVDKPPGQEYVELPQATERFGYADGTSRLGIVEFSDEEDPTHLLEVTYQTLVNSSRPRVSYRTQVLDDEETTLGDTVTIIRNDYGIRYQTRIYKREVNLLSPHKVKIELGDQVKSYTVEKISSLTKEIETSREELYESSQDLVNKFKDMLAGSYLNGDGYNYDLRVGNEYGLPAGLYSFDKPIDQNPTKVIYVGAGSMLISNEKDADGNWIWKTMATGDGIGAGMIGADQIIAGSITTDHISADGINAEAIVVGDQRLSTTIDSMGITIRENTTIDGIPVSEHMQDVISGLDSLEDQISALEGGGGNLIMNSNYGTASNPSDAWWADGLTWDGCTKIGVVYPLSPTSAPTWIQLGKGDY